MIQKNTSIRGKDLRYDFGKSADGNPVLLLGADLSAKFELTIPDLDGAQLDRLPLPEEFLTESLVKEVYRQATMTYRGKLIHPTQFTNFSFKFQQKSKELISSDGIVTKLSEPRPQPIWVRKL